jgi:hypothetical protein
MRCAREPYQRVLLARAQARTAYDSSFDAIEEDEPLGAAPARTSREAPRGGGGQRGALGCAGKKRGRPGAGPEGDEGSDEPYAAAEHEVGAAPRGLCTARCACLLSCVPCFARVFRRCEEVVAVCVGGVAYGCPVCPLPPQGHPDAWRHASDGRRALGRHGSSDMAAGSPGSGRGWLAARGPPSGPGEDALGSGDPDAPERESPAGGRSRHAQHARAHGGGGARREQGAARRSTLPSLDGDEDVADVAEQLLHLRDTAGARPAARYAGGELGAARLP